MAFTQVFNFTKPAAGLIAFNVPLNTNFDRIDSELSTHTHAGVSYASVEWGGLSTSIQDHQHTGASWQPIPPAGICRQVFYMTPSLSIGTLDVAKTHYCFRTPIAATCKEVHAFLGSSVGAGTTVNINAFAGVCVGILSFPDGIEDQQKSLLNLSQAMTIGQSAYISSNNLAGGCAIDITVTFILAGDLQS